MEQIRNSDIGSKTIFISYLNDDNTTISGYVELIEYSEGFVVFKTGSNILRIPSVRVLKIKEKI